MPPSLTERLEIRVDSETLARIDTWRSASPGFPSRGEAVRQLIERGLEKRPQEIRPSDGEKIIIKLLVDIMEKVKVDKQDLQGAKFILNAIQGGHYWAPHWEWQGLIHDDVDDPADVSFVVDVLDMWSFIEDSFEALTPEQKQEYQNAVTYHKEPKFIGFDGNNEGKLRSIAKFFIEEMNRFTDFKNRTLNSHSRKRATYEAMLRSFEPIRERLDGRLMNPGELAQVMNLD